MKNKKLKLKKFKVYNLQKSKTHKVVGGFGTTTSPTGNSSLACDPLATKEC